MCFVFVYLFVCLFTCLFTAVEVWLQYAQFAMDQMSAMSEGVAFPRDVCERAIVRCGLHVSKVTYLDTRWYNSAVKPLNNGHIWDQPFCPL